MDFVLSTEGVNCFKLPKAFEHIITEIQDYGCWIWNPECSFSENRWKLPRVFSYWGKIPQGSVRLSFIYPDKRRFKSRKLRKIRSLDRTTESASGIWWKVLKGIEWGGRTQEILKAIKVGRSTIAIELN